MGRNFRWTRRNLCRAGDSRCVCGLLPYNPAMHRTRHLPVLFWLVVILFAPFATVWGQQRPHVQPFDLPKFDTKYYVVYSDLDASSLLEVFVRITKMAEVYRDRTRGFSGAINQKLPLVLYKSLDDYYAEGGAQGSAGVFNGRMLMVFAGERGDARTWHIVQHEGFHQFARGMIRGDLPVWIDEGMAEYFGEALFTGDDYVTGIIPEWRRKRIRETMEAGSFMPIEQFMNLAPGQWHEKIEIKNYDQAWSMVQFLAHGEDGKYQPAIAAFLSAINRGQNWNQAWINAFGDSKGLEQHWQTYWSSMPENPTDHLYRQATVAILTSFLARATAQQQTFASMQSFAAIAAAGKLESSLEDVLPRRLLAQALSEMARRCEAGERFSMVLPRDAKLPTIIAQTVDGQTVTGRFSLRNRGIGKVTVETTGEVVGKKSGD